jgi:hypothetical protein
MGHVIVRIIELLIANALAAAVTIMFLIALYAIAHSVHMAGRQH